MMCTFSGCDLSNVRGERVNRGTRSKYAAGILKNLDLQDGGTRSKNAAGILKNLDSRYSLWLQMVVICPITVCAVHCDDIGVLTKTVSLPQALHIAKKSTR